MISYNEALVFATIAHEGQFRKDGVTPYIAHPIAVSQLVNDDDSKIVALLHDVLEDTDTELNSRGILRYESFTLSLSKHLADALIAITHNRNEPYLDYIRRVSENPIALKVKLADIHHNTTNLPSEKFITKVRLALPILLSKV